MVAVKLFFLFCGVTGIEYGSSLLLSFFCTGALAMKMPFAT